MGRARRYALAIGGVFHALARCAPGADRCVPRSTTGPQAFAHARVRLLERGVEQLQILYYPFDPMHPRFSAGPDHGSARLQIESFEPGVGGARLKASLRGELFYHQSPNTRPIPHRTMSLDLTIDTEMVRN